MPSNDAIAVSGYFISIGSVVLKYLLKTTPVRTAGSNKDQDQYI